MRFEGEAQRLERAHGVTLVEWPQTATRMARCSEHLHGLVIEQRLRHPGHPALDKHVANAIAVPVHGHRAWRLSKSADAAQIDALIALSMAAERASQPRRTPQLVGWL